MEDSGHVRHVLVAQWAKPTTYYAHGDVRGGPGKDPIEERFPFIQEGGQEDSIIPFIQEDKTAHQIVLPLIHIKSATHLPIHGE